MRHPDRYVCTACLDAARNDLRTIGELCGSLPAEAVVAGVESEAMMMLGPAADPEAWQYTALSALFGRVPADYLTDTRDEAHPLWVLGTWEQIWRDYLRHDTDRHVTIGGAVHYLGVQLGYMADQPEPDFGVFAVELHRCRWHLEDVVHDGIRDELGAPCLQCGTKMVRVFIDTGAQDIYRCKPCHRELSADQYRYAVGVAYRAHATRLSAHDLAERIGVKASVIRVWGARGLIRKRGRNAEGVILYDVGDTQLRAGVVANGAQ